MVHLWGSAGSANNSFGRSSVANDSTLPPSRSTRFEYGSVELNVHLQRVAKGVAKLSVEGVAERRVLLSGGSPEPVRREGVAGDGVACYRERPRRVNMRKHVKIPPAVNILQCIQETHYGSSHVSSTVHPPCGHSSSTTSKCKRHYQANSANSLPGKGPPTRHSAFPIRRRALIESD